MLGGRAGLDAQAVWLWGTFHESRFCVLLTRKCILQVMEVKNVFMVNSGVGGVTSDETEGVLNSGSFSLKCSMESVGD